MENSTEVFNTRAGANDLLGTSARSSAIFAVAAMLALALVACTSDPPNDGSVDAPSPSNVIIAAHGLESASGETDSGSPAPTIDAAGLDPNYDDRWTENIPPTINGLPVLFVTTPKNQACTVNIPIVHVGTPNESIQQHLNKVDAGSVLKQVRAIKGVPANVEVSFAGPSASAEMIRSSIVEWNAAKAAFGCDEPWGIRPELVQP